MREIKKDLIKENDEFILDIKRLGINGEGVGFYNRMAVFVDGAIPGEGHDVVVTKVDGKMAYAKTKEIKHQSPYRKQPECPYFDICGGCSIMHIDYEESLKLKRELNLQLPLIWNQTHMVNNYRTCNYYYSRGVEYALLGKEITLEEILEIAKKSDISTMVEVVSKPSVAFSKRKLLTNYYTDAKEDVQKELTVLERGTNEKYHLYENQDGTSFFLDVITNGTGVISDLYHGGVDFIILREYGLEDCFDELITDTYSYVQSGCVDSSYVEKYKKLGDSTNFFFKKTIYKVKKNG